MRFDPCHSGVPYGYFKGVSRKLNVGRICLYESVVAVQ